jgi:hypothetical protein
VAIVTQDAADAFYAAYKASLGWNPSPADDAKAKAAWRAGLGALINYLVANTVVSVKTTGVTDAGAPGGPLPITNQPGTGGIS